MESRIFEYEKKINLVRYGDGLSPVFPHFANGWVSKFLLPDPLDPARNES